MQNQASSTNTVPVFLAGPILRKVSPSEVTVWYVSSTLLSGNLSVYQEGERLAGTALDEARQVRVGNSAWVCLVTLNGNFPVDTALEYDIETEQGNMADLVPGILYEGEKRVEFTICSRASYLLHGSCRNPSHTGADSLVAADKKLAGLAATDRPCVLIMSGDQIYADHVAGPLLGAIQQFGEQYGLVEEKFSDACVGDTVALRHAVSNIYGRNSVLPVSKVPETAAMKWRKQPVFTSTDCDNHLISLAEFIGMYCLVWSPSGWRNIDLTPPQSLTEAQRTRWLEEKEAIESFTAGLSKVRRLLAHLPTYMIFDDHDVTDDWNLTVGWEQAAYSHPFSRIIIGNGLLAYWLCQGWGNAPENFPDNWEQMADSIYSEGQDGFASSSHHQQFIDTLYQFNHWHYEVETSPKILVLDTRTQRWQSESRMNKPSGLMDWESLMAFQQATLGEQAVIVVSATPMFGVKFIEAIQRVFTWFGLPLMVDAENWMAHPGSANTLLSIFTHTKTPTNFVVLSGDVHYSFAYDIRLRFRRNSPHIYQICCSGIKNTFPEKLLRVCELADRVLYAPYSPLNLFTKRKRMKVLKRDPDLPGGNRLVNSTAIGEVRIGEDGVPTEISLLTGEGKQVHFPPPKDD